jgi:hypothetical protein
MSSIIEGYNYDIFVSYRQKDNKHDGWVTEFVENLRGELESTFKEDIGVYFDINPHDGLLETHDVDESLKEKLKCLVFLPIISRTYCDPKSYAWEYEFKAFVEQASRDRFGLKVKLHNGNVASRILPIFIHEVHLADQQACESVLGNILRGIDFTYKSPGVNRPLRPREENPYDNVNHIIYRDQINKVAIAIDEIFRGLNKMSDVRTGSHKQLTQSTSAVQRSGTTAFLEYHGQIDFEQMDFLLERLKSTSEFMILNKTTRKKVYSIFSECLDNILHYSLKPSSNTEIKQPCISIGNQHDKIVIQTRNPISDELIELLNSKLKEINQLDREELKVKYAEKINRELRKDETSAGLGFMLMVLKSGNRLEYNFSRDDDNIARFDLKITVNKFAGSKLLIDQTVNSPRIHFDPDEGIFEISGESRPPNVAEFYKVLFSWLEQYSGYLPDIQNSNKQVSITFNFEYFNSSSSKYILDFCRQIADWRSKGKNITVKWYYEKEDLDMLESGKEMSRIAKFPFEFVLKD